VRARRSAARAPPRLLGLLGIASVACPAACVACVPQLSAPPVLVYLLGAPPTGGTHCESNGRPWAAKGLHVVVSLVISDEAFSSKKSPSWPCHGAHALPSPFLLMAFKASLVFPAVPGRRFGPAVPGPRRVAIISGPTTGGRRCLRYGTLLNRGPGVRSSWSRSGSFSGLPRPGVARELPFKSHFEGEAKFSFT
jgi:hypothetical protein